MTTGQFIRLAADIAEHGKRCGYHEYIENIIEPNKVVAGDYYGIGQYDVVAYGYQIASDLDNLGFAVIPDELTK